MEQQRALNALEPYVALSKSATSPRAAADLISQATSAPQTYVFAELLQTPNVQALRDSPEYASHLRLLEIFAWGTLSDYQETPGLPQLTPKQQHKLLLLSLLPLLTNPKTLSYSILIEKLSLPSTAALESLITAGIYEDLLRAHLDPLNQVVRVASVAPLRDLPPGRAPAAYATLDSWEGRCNDALKDIERQIRGIKARNRYEKARESRKEAMFEDAVNKSDDEKEGKTRGGKRGPDTAGLKGGPGDDAMDVDDVLSGRGIARGAKRLGRTVVGLK